MFKEGQYVECKRTSLRGKVDSREWENGWRYDIIATNSNYFYREEHEIKEVKLVELNKAFMKSWFKEFFKVFVLRGLPVIALALGFHIWAN